MKGLFDYRLLQVASHSRPSACSKSVPPVRYQNRSAKHEYTAKDLSPGNAASTDVGRSAMARRPCTSHLLRVEETMLRYGLSERQIDSVVRAARDMFEAVKIDPLREAECTQQWKDTVRLFSEHSELRSSVLCQRYQKRDNATRAEISSRHPNVDKGIREGYLKVMQRLEAFRASSTLRFPPNCGAFLQW